MHNPTPTESLLMRAGWVLTNERHGDEPIWLDPVGGTKTTESHALHILRNSLSSSPEQGGTGNPQGVGLQTQGGGEAISNLVR